MTRLERRRTVLRTLALWLLIAFAALPAAGQRNPLGAAVGDPDISETSVELVDIQKKTDELGLRLQEWQSKSAEYLQAGRDAQLRAQQIDDEIARLQQRKDIEIAPDATTASLSAQLLEAEQDLAAARQEATELDAMADQRLERRRRLPELLALAKQRLVQIVEAAAPTSNDAEEGKALQTLHALRREVLETEIQTYQNELKTYDERGAFIGKQRDRATLRITYYGALSTSLREAAQQLERVEIERENAATKRLLDELTAIPPGLKQSLDELYARNAALASLWTSDGGLHEQIDDVSVKLSRAEARVAEIEAELTRLAARVEAVGLADSVGLLLRRHRAEAPDIGMYQRFIRMRQEEIGGVQLQQIRLREQRQVLADIDVLVDETMASIDEPIAPEEQEALELLLRQLFETQRKYMDALIQDYETYFQKLVDFDASQQQLIERTKDLLDFIDERILWIPSGKAVQPDFFSDGRDGLAWLLGRKYWLQLGRGVQDAAARLWPLNLLVLLLAFVFVPFRRWVLPRIARLGEIAKRRTCTRFGPTGMALGLTLLVAIWLPGILAYAGWRLGVSPAATQFTRNFADALVLTAAFWMTLRFPRQLVRPGGVAEAHCEWPESAARGLWREIGWFSALAVPVVFILSVFEMHGEDLWRETVGRLGFLLCMLAIVAFNYLALRSSGPLAQVLQISRSRRPWAWRAVRLASSVVPLGLAAAALRGFYWTSLQVASRLHVTLVFLLLLAIAVQLVARWSMIASRVAALENEKQGEEPETSAPVMAVSRLMIGTGVLLAFLGASAIWADLLPATRILQQVELWDSTQTVTVSALDASGVERTSTEEQLVAVTLADLLRALLVGLLTLASIRALPGLLEATLFRRLGPGERYAYSTIVKYTVVLAGLAFAFDAIGIGWSSIQWLVAAVGLGLGFGLQEIFANFISGLIILFERPIRVGDTVSVGEIHGKVTKIRIRATWITAFDRKELIVPNKAFVTGQLVNWTLSDQVLRLTVPVGVAYGSDTQLAIDTLLGVARECRAVLSDPRPQAFFLGFGDSSLSFELRAFVRTVDQLFLTRHALHMAIDKAFRERGIEIAFPQRDLHLRSVPHDWRPPPAGSERA